MSIAIVTATATIKSLCDHLCVKFPELDSAEVIKCVEEFFGSSALAPVKTATTKAGKPKKVAEKKVPSGLIFVEKYSANACALIIGTDVDVAKVESFMKTFKTNFTDSKMKHLKSGAHGPVYTIALTRKTEFETALEKSDLEYKTIDDAKNIDGEKKEASAYQKYCSALLAEFKADHTSRPEFATVDMTSLGARSKLFASMWAASDEKKEADAAAVARKASTSSTGSKAADKKTTVVEKKSDLPLVEISLAENDQGNNYIENFGGETQYVMAELPIGSGKKNKYVLIGTQDLTNDEAGLISVIPLDDEKRDYATKMLPPKTSILDKKMIETLTKNKYDAENLAILASFFEEE